MDVAVLDPATGAFLAARPRMLDLATRILGSAVEAEDVVQESWVRWQLTDRNNVLNPTAFLATTTTRIADVLHLEPAHTRQLVFRAPRHLSAGRHRPVNRDIHLRWVRAFLGAARTGNLIELERLLVADVTCHRFSSCPV